MKMTVDPTVCAGNGVCHELVPELIALDEWGFPVLGLNPSDRTTVDVPRDVATHAKRAANACPKLALKVK